MTTPDDLRERIAEALYEHRPVPLKDYAEMGCSCGWRSLTGGFDAHIADAVLAALDLQQVGWVHDVALDGKVHGHAPGCDRVGCRPVYRLGGSHE